MCGIGGMFLRHGELIALPAIERIMSILGHRGPDGCGFHESPGVALVHTRLSIIDLTGGVQPIYNRDHSLCLVANGEIYNYVELRHELERRGHAFATRSDNEVILHAYAEYGDDCLAHLDGMFAFALWDSRWDRLLLARDRLGIKPLYLSDTGAGVYFASELKALTACQAFTPTVSPTALAQFLNHGFISGNETILEGVEQLLPGHLAVVKRGRITERRCYWSLTEAESPAMSFDQASERFDELIEKVVRQHLRADVPVGLFLSGGVDSSLLTALLSRHLDEPLRTYSVGFPWAPATNELASAKRVAELFGTQHTVLEPDPDTLLRTLPKATWAADGLLNDRAALPTWLLARAAAREVKVIFTGEGADEVFAGYGRYRVPAHKRWLRQLRGRSGWAFRCADKLRRPWARSLLRPELQRLGVDCRAPIRHSWEQCPAQWSDLQRSQFTDLSTWLPDDLLVKLDRMSMAHGVEGRVPFLDHRLVEFGFGLPDELKINRRDGKVFLQRWSERHLPREHLWARKRGFSVPIDPALPDAVLAQLEQAMPDHPAYGEWFNRDGLQQLIARQRAVGRGHGVLWAALQFGLWYERFVSEPENSLHELITGRPVAADFSSAPTFAPADLSAATSSYGKACPART